MQVFGGKENHVAAYWNDGNNSLDIDASTADTQVVRFGANRNTMVSFGMPCKKAGLVSISMGGGATTLSAANLMAGSVFAVDPEGSATLTVTTAALLAAAIPDFASGDTLGPYFIHNNGSGTEVITVACAAGGTLVTDTATLTYGTNMVGVFYITFDSATTYQLYLFSNT